MNSLIEEMTEKCHEIHQSYPMGCFDFESDFFHLLKPEPLLGLCFGSLLTLRNRGGGDGNSGDNHNNNNETHQTHPSNLSNHHTADEPQCTNHLYTSKIIYYHTLDSKKNPNLYKTWAWVPA